MDIKCDVILPVCDQCEFTKNCVESIVNNTFMEYRLIVINNGRKEDTKTYLAKMVHTLGERLLVIQNMENVGWVKAVNQGIDASTAPFLCFQNDDTIVTPRWLDKMIAILERDERIGLVNPTWEGRPNNISIEEYGKTLEMKYTGQYVETDWARGFSMVLKRRVIEKIGKMDEIYGMAYFDDVDFSIRAIRAGFLVVRALDTYVYHHRNVTAFEIFKGGRWNELHERNKQICYKKWGRPLRIAMILDAKHCIDAKRLAGIKDTVYYLARRQNHIDLWSPCDIGKEFRHTNVAFRSYGGILTRPISLFDIYLNGKKKKEKRYDAVFDYHAKASTEDFDKTICMNADRIKEETREAAHV